MNRRTSTGALAAMLAPLALVLGGCSADPKVPTRTTAPPPPSASSSATPSTTVGATPPLLSGAPQGALAPGRYTVTANGAADLPRVVLDIPAGFESGGFYVASEGGFLSYWGISGLFKDPCTREGGTVALTGTAAEVVDELVAGLGVRSSTPTSTRIDGHEGVYVELTSPGLDYASCQDGFTYWDSGDGARYVQSAGVLDRLWVLDVDGKVVVLNTSSEPGTAVGPMETAKRMVERAAFVGPDGSALR